MGLADVFPPEAILCGLTGRTERDVIAELVRHAVALGRIPAWTEGDVICLLEERECVGSTALGNGIAFPHCRSAHTEQFVGVAGFGHANIPFRAIDGEPVDVIFLLLAPTDRADKFLDILGRLVVIGRDRRASGRFSGAAEPPNTSRHSSRSSINCLLMTERCPGTSRPDVSLPSTVHPPYRALTCHGGEGSPMPHLVSEPPASPALSPTPAPSNDEPVPQRRWSGAGRDVDGNSAILVSEPSERTRRGWWGWPWFCQETRDGRSEDPPRAHRRDGAESALIRAPPHCPGACPTTARGGAAIHVAKPQGGLTMDEHNLTRHIRIGKGEWLHLRKAAVLSEFAQHYPCELRITNGDRHANAKSVLDVLCLGACPGDDLLLEANGPGSLQALDGLSGLITQ